MPNKEKGFSLIELLIVVAIILIIAAIAIPNLLRSKMAANEASSVGSVRTINTGSVTYSSTYGAGYPPALTNIGGAAASTVSCAGAQLIDNALATATTAAAAEQVLLHLHRGRHRGHGRLLHGQPVLHAGRNAQRRGTDRTAIVLLGSERCDSLHVERKHAGRFEPGIAVSRVGQLSG